MFNQKNKEQNEYIQTNTEIIQESSLYAPSVLEWLCYNLYREARRREAARKYDESITMLTQILGNMKKGRVYYDSQLTLGRAYFKSELYSKSRDSIDNLLSDSELKDFDMDLQFQNEGKELLRAINQAQSSN